MKNKSIIILTVIILLIIIGLLVYFNQKPMTTNQTSSNNQTPPTATTNPTKKTFTLAEVAQHNNADDCWMVIDGKVYDATQYVSQHPGGKAIVNGCGKDATVLFNQRPNTKNSPHPDSAIKALNNLYLGELSK